MNNRKRQDLLKSFKGDWALVTGASSGIGQEYAEQLAASGMNIVLVARGLENLKKHAEHFEKIHHVRTIVIPTDLAKAEEIPRLKEVLNQKGVRIRFLCHAAGFGVWGTFLEGDADLYARLVGVHVTAGINLLLGFHDDLASYPTSAAIIVSSRAGDHPMPTMAVYGAAKAFSQSLSQSLFCEWEKEGIQVQALMPGGVDTALEANQRLLADGVIQKSDLQSPKEVVNASIQGLVDKKPRVFTGKGLLLERIFAWILPRRIFLNAVKNHFTSKTRLL